MGEKTLLKGLCVIVLILAKIELFFFTVAGMELCFGFLTKTVLITEGCFTIAKQCNTAVLTQSMAFCLSPHPTSKAGWRCTRNWEGTQSEQLISSYKRDTPHDMASHSAYK